VQTYANGQSAEKGVRETASVLRLVSIILARHEMRGLRRLYDDFDRDILLPILLGEIAFHNIGVRENDDTLNEGEFVGIDCKLKPCNAYSISAATGLPRETVRRKIARLIELGWLNKRHNGHLYVSARALNHFGSLLRSRDLPELLETADKVRRLYAAIEERPRV